MTTQITLPRELLEQLTDALANRCGTNSDEWPLINTVRAALTEQVQPAQGERAELIERLLTMASWCSEDRSAQELKRAAALLQSNAEQVHITDHPDVRYLRKWLNEEQIAPIDKVALANVLVMLTHPKKRVPLTDEQLAELCGRGNYKIRAMIKEIPE